MAGWTNDVASSLAEALSLSEKFASVEPLLDFVIRDCSLALAHVALSLQPLAHKRQRPPYVAFPCVFIVNEA